MANTKAWFSTSLRPRKSEGSLGWTAQDGHLDSHTAPELWLSSRWDNLSLSTNLDSEVVLPPALLTVNSLCCVKCEAL